VSCSQEETRVSFSPRLGEPALATGGHSHVTIWTDRLLLIDAIYGASAVPERLSVGGGGSAFSGSHRLGTSDARRCSFVVSKGRRRYIWSLPSAVKVFAFGLLLIERAGSRSALVWLWRSV